MSVASANPKARPPMTSPRTGIRRILRGSTCGRMRSASNWMPRPRNGATRPNAMDQANIAPVGLPNLGRPGMASERVPKPVRESRPMKTSVPMPADSSPGTSTTPSMGPPRPEASSSRNAPRSGEPSSELMAAKLPAPAITAPRRVRRVPRRQAHGQRAEPASQQDQRSLGPQDHSEAQSRDRGEQHAGKLARREHATGMEPVGGRVPPDARQVGDRQGHQEAGQGEQGHGPPGRRGVEARGRAECP